MNEAEFDALVGSRPFGTADAKKAEDLARRCAALAAALWGRDSAQLPRQLLASRPEIPPGFELADFRELLRTTEMMASWLHDPRSASFFPHGDPFPKISVGDQQFSLYEAQCEVVRRAIEYLESR